MKNLLKKTLLALFGKLARKHARQINKAQKWIDHAQATFATAVEEAQIAEERFDKVIADAQFEMNKVKEELEQKLSTLQGTVDETATRKEQATKFKNKIKTFIED